ncbi:TPA: hypothetical protein ACGPD8_003709 [Klebsiella quasipneumoniae]
MTSKLTRERLQEIAEDGFLKHGESKELARIALAAMNGEPFSYIIQDKYERERGVEGHLSRSHVSKYVSQEDINEHEITCIPLYRHAQPAPVVLDEVTAEDCPAFVKYDVTEVDEAWARGSNACRAAMLQAEPVCSCPSGNGSLRWPCPAHPGNSPAQSDCCPAQNSVAPAQSPIAHGYRPECECSGCKATARICAELSANSPASPGCWCRTCRPVVLNDMRFVLCPDCGNKRCPRANNHRNACTGSNETGQEGSAYPAAPQEVPDGK